MENNKSRVSSGAIQLYNLFIHGEIDRRAFMEGLKQFATGGMTVAALAQALLPNYAAGQQVSKTDERIKASYETVPSPQGNGSIKGYLVRPVSADAKVVSKGLPDTAVSIGSPAIVAIEPGPVGTAAR